MSSRVLPEREAAQRAATHDAGAAALAQGSGRPGALSAELLLSRLRGEGGERPEVDPGLAGGLRDWLEDELSSVVWALPGETVPIRVTKEAVNQVLVCEAHYLARRGAPRVPTIELARGALVDALFRQWVTVGSIEDPWADSLSGLECDGDEELLRFLAELGEDPRRGLEEEVRSHAEAFVSTWPVSAPSWLARTQERIEVPLAGGHLVLAGVVDLAFGAPCAGRASVCLVELKSGSRRLEHRGDLHYYALLETLRSGAPPFRIATYYSRTGELDAEQVREDVLLGALHRTLAAAERLCRLASGSEPKRTPNPLCAWCSDLPNCEPGQARAGGNTPHSAGDPAAEEYGDWSDPACDTTEPTEP